MLRIMTGYRTLARNRDFTVLWTGETLNELGSRVSMFVFPLLAYQVSGSALTAALVEAGHLVGLTGTLLPAGVLADRCDRRRLMRAASGAGVALYSSLVVAGLSFGLTIPHLAVVGFGAGMASGVFAPAEMSALRTVVPTEDLPTALSQNQARQHVAGLIGGPLGGLLYGVTRWLPFAVDAVTYAVSWVTLGMIRTDLSPHPVGSARPRPMAQVREGLGFIWHRPFFRALLTWAAVVNLLVNALFFVALLRLIQAGFHPAQIGLVDAAAGVAGIIGALAAPAIIDRFPTGRLTAVIAWSFVPLSIPIIFWNHPAVVAAGLAGGLLLNPAGNAGISSYGISQTPIDLQGRVNSASRFLSMSVMPLSPVVGGLLLSWWGGAWAVAALLALTGLAALIPTLSRSIRTVPRPRDWPPAAGPAPLVCAHREPAPAV